MQQDALKILALVERGSIDVNDATLLFQALQGQPLSGGSTPKQQPDESNPTINRNYARYLLKQVRTCS